MTMKRTSGSVNASLASASAEKQRCTEASDPALAAARAVAGDDARERFASVERPYSLFRVRFRSFAYVGDSSIGYPTVNLSYCVIADRGRAARASMSLSRSLQGQALAVGSLSGAG